MTFEEMATSMQMSLRQKYPTDYHRDLIERSIHTVKLDILLRRGESLPRIQHQTQACLNTVRLNNHSLRQLCLVMEVLQHILKPVCLNPYLKQDVQVVDSRAFGSTHEEG